MKKRQEEEIEKFKSEMEKKLKLEVEARIGMENKFKKSLVEKDSLEAQLKQFFQKLSGVEEKMQEKNEEIKQGQLSNAKIMKLVPNFISH